MFWVKVHRIKDHIVAAVCDEELIDKKLDFDGIIFHLNRKFYGGEIVDKEKVTKILENCTIGNLVGNNIIDLAIEKKYIDKNNIISINGVPHAQFIK
ncbi:MAG: DUF424 family protein [Candidatus Aenigmatarchaeota archaeon]|nr:DUF424 family protein [Candidatus Aenigmarchaeota archaeon]